MRISTILAGLAVVISVLSDSLKIPGDSPLEFCNTHREGDILVISRANFDPNPPQADKPLNISVSGYLKSPVTEGAYAKVVVKCGFITLLKTTVDLCELLEYMDLTCPLKKGKIDVVETMHMGRAFFPGTFSIFADAYTFDNKHISCLKAKIKPPRRLNTQEL